MASPGWVVVVPVKAATRGKSRLAGVLSDDERADLVRAMALDTVTAALGAPDVRAVVVVTADGPLRRDLTERVVVVDEPAAARDGLNAALRAGADAAGRLDPDAGVVALLGDLPALRPADLTAALRRAAVDGRSFVADAGGTGTTLLAAGPGLALDPRFGRDSRAAHAASGATELTLDPGSTLTRDVDVPGDLDRAAALGVGGRTAAWLAARASAPAAGSTASG